jgi:glyoxylase-like metal-dependent hydrolase (beta-lactamase superfamily II)
MQKRLGLGFLCLTLSATASAQSQDFSKVEVKAQKVAGNVHVLFGAGGNIAVSVGEDGLLIVDDQFAPLAPKIEEALRALSDKPLRFVLNTHWHGDHTGGNLHFGAKAPIVAHDNVRKRLAAGAHLKIGGIERKVDPAPKGALPVLTYGRRVSVHFNGEEIRAVHFPSGHTDGDSVIWFRGSNVVHMGDDFFAGRFPLIDITSGGSIQGLIEGVEKVLGIIPDDVKVIPGHGPLSTKDDLRAYLGMLKDTSGAVQSAIAAGKSLEEMKKENLLGKWSDTWGKGFIKPNLYIEMLYRSLSGTKSGLGPMHPHGHRVTAAR